MGPELAHANGWAGRWRIWAVTDAPDTSLRVRVTATLKLSLFLVLAGNVVRLPAFSTGNRDTAILLSDLAVALLLAASGLSMLNARSLKLDAVAMTGLVFAGIGALSTAFAVPQFDLNSFELLVSLGYLARWIVYFAIYIVTINVVRRSDIDSVRRTFETMVAAFAAFGLVQAAFFPNFAMMVFPESRPYADWDPQGQRLVSTFLDPNFAGGLLMMGLAWHLARIATGARVPLWKPMLLLAALLLTASRSSILSLAVVGVLIVIIRGVSWRMVKLMAGGAVVLAALAPKLVEMAHKYNKLQVDKSAMGRVIGWIRGWHVFTQHPILGIGFNTWGFVQERYGFERLFASSYAIDGGLFFVLVMTGILGLATFLVMIAIVGLRARKVWRDRQRSADDRSLAIASFAIFFGLCVHSLFNNSLFLPFLMQPLWIICGLAFVIARDGSVEEDATGLLPCMPAYTGRKT